MPIKVLNLVLHSMLQDKCECYWPNPEDTMQQEIGKFQVRLVKTEIFADYTIRTLSVIYKVGEIAHISSHLI